MDQIERLEEIVLEVLHEFMAAWQYDTPAPYHLVVDKEVKRYVLFEMGFEKRKFYHITLFHLAINNNKIWIYEDKSEQGLADLLLSKDVQSDEIILGYFSEAYRTFTDFAVV
ncbi:MAG: element excision factor XisI family protein [Bacteroidota bacterium]